MSGNVSEPSAAPAGGTGAKRNVVALGWVAFFGGLAQDMIQPVLPVFYVSVLGLSREFIGLIEGTLTTLVSLMKIGAGYLSDALGVRKPIVFAGYALSAIGRFSLGFASSGFLAFGARSVDALGKGLKDAPRDALVADSAGGRTLGVAFGIQRTLDTLGSVAGPLITVALLRTWATHQNRYRQIFWVAGLIAAVPLVIVALVVRERVLPVQKVRIELRGFGRPFGLFLVAVLIFTLGNSSDAFSAPRISAWRRRRFRCPMRRSISSPEFAEYASRLMTPTGHPARWGLFM
jgi:hypothetical protein